MPAPINASAITQAGLDLYNNGGGGYLIFDKDTQGKSGRKILIHKSLVKKFSALVDDSAKGQLVIQGIKQLSAKAGGLSSFSSLNKAASHMSVIGHLLVSYDIVQAGSDQSSSAIQINNIELSNYGKDLEPGLYYMKSAGSKGWETDDDKGNDRFYTHYAAINGLTERFSQAASELMPTMVDKAWSPDSFTAYDLFYNPKTAQHKGMNWRTPTQKRTNQQSASLRLAKALHDAQKIGHEVQWVVHGNGSKVFSDALKAIPGVKLDKHKVLFAAPTEPLGQLLPLVSRSGMTVHEDIAKGNNHDWTSLANRLQLNGFNTALKDLGPEYAERSEELREEGATAKLKFAQSLSGAFASGGGITLALTSPHIALAGLGSAVSGGAVGVAAAGISAVALWQKAKSLRNIAGNVTTNANLNPHMQPFMNPDQFNAQARRQHGNAANTFLALVRNAWR